MTKARRNEDITGTRFHRLTVVRQTDLRSSAGKLLLECRCDCGATTLVSRNQLKTGNTKSCGCWKVAHMTKHGDLYSPEYRVWQGMVQRCTNPKAEHYENYGGRGVTVCERWRDYSNFKTDMGQRPKGTTIDRIDNSRGYEPGNCRWATAEQQANNKRTNVIVEAAGERMTLTQAARKFGWTGNMRYHLREGHNGVREVPRG